MYSRRPDQTTTLQVLVSHLGPYLLPSSAYHLSLTCHTLRPYQEYRYFLHHWNADVVTALKKPQQAQFLRNLQGIEITKEGADGKVVGEEGAQAFVDILTTPSASPALQYLTLRNQNLGDNGLTILGDAAEAAIKAADAAAAAAATTSPYPSPYAFPLARTLEALDLSYNSVTNPPNAMTNGIPSYSQYSSEKDTTPIAPPRLPGCLSPPPPWSSLKTLNVEGNNLGGWGVKALMESLAYAYKALGLRLSTLNMSKNKMGDLGAMGVANWLEDVAAVYDAGLGQEKGKLDLDISHNKIDTPGIVSLGWGLFGDKDGESLDDDEPEKYREGGDVGHLIYISVNMYENEVTIVGLRELLRLRRRYRDLHRYTHPIALTLLKLEKNEILVEEKEELFEWGGQGAEEDIETEEQEAQAAAEIVWIKEVCKL